MTTKTPEASEQLGSKEWNNEMYLKHSTPYHGIAGKIEKYRTRKIFQELSKSLKKDAVIVEVGCEQGNMLAYFEERLQERPEVQIYGLDISPTALKDAEKKLSKRVRLVEYDVVEDPLPQLPQVDVLICSEVLEHIPNYQKAIEHLAQIADKETLVIITVPLEKWKNRIKSFLTKIGLFNLLFKGIEASLSEWHVNDFSKEDILNALQPHFHVRHYSLLVGLHQMIVLSKK